MCDVMKKNVAVNHLFFSSPYTLLSIPSTEKIKRKPTTTEKIMNNTVSRSFSMFIFFVIIVFRSIPRPPLDSSTHLYIVISIDDFFSSSFFFCHVEKRLRGIELLIKLDLSSYNQILAYFHRLILPIFLSSSCCQLPLRGCRRKLL